MIKIAKFFARMLTDSCQRECVCDTNLLGDYDVREWCLSRIKAASQQCGAAFDSSAYL